MVRDRLSHIARVMERLKLFNLTILYLTKLANFETIPDPGKSGFVILTG